MKYPAIALDTLLVLSMTSCGGTGAGGVDEAITRVYEADEGRAILYDTENDNAVVVVRDPESLFTILEKTGDNKWIIVERAPFNPGPGRVETVQLVWYVPGSRNIDLKALKPGISIVAMTFHKTEEGEILHLEIEGDYKVLEVPLTGLLPGEIPEIEESERELSGTIDDYPEAGQLITLTGDEAPVLELRLGEGEDRIGRGAVEKWLEGGRLMYAVPSFAACKGKLYFVDAINFRILVYDYAGTRLGKVEYPESLTGRGMINVRDIAVDNDFLYLLSAYENAVYVIDYETEDIAAIIGGTETPPGKFGDLRSVQTDFSGNILLLDANDNMIHTYKRDNLNFSLSGTIPYSQPGQLVPASDGTVFRAETFTGGFSVIRSDGTVTGRFECEHPVTGASVFAVDSEGYIYVRVTEDEPGSQFPGPVTARVISPGGRQLFSIRLSPWTNGPMERNVVVDAEGSVFEAFFDGVPDDEERPATKLIVRRYR